MWTYRNPVEIEFGLGTFDKLAGLIGGRRYALVTYDEPVFDQLSRSLVQAAGAPVLVIRDVAPNPDFRLLANQTQRFAALQSLPDIIVALGGGSVIDSAKVFAAAGGNFDKVRSFLETRTGAEALSAVPIIAVPTTAGTGSEVTCWATVWDEGNGKKYSLARPYLYPAYAVIDPDLMLGKPRNLTISTGLDALSHALESLWNRNANPVSANYAVTAARQIIEVLPKLASDLGNIELRSRMAMAAMFAGLAFSNTKTAIAHSLSYPITLHHGIPHGIACSFTLPMVLRSVWGVDGICGDSLRAIFGNDRDQAVARLEGLLATLDVATDHTAYGIDQQEWSRLIDTSFQGERGWNFLGSQADLIEASRSLQA